MVNSSLHEILKTFSKEELKRFEDLVSSPFYNKNSVVIKLFAYLKKNAPELKDENINKEIAWKNIYGNKKFDYGLWKNLVYELNKLAEKFLQIKESESKDFRNGLDILYQLKKRALNRQFERKLKFYREKLNNERISTDFYFYNFNFEMLEQDYLHEWSKIKSRKHFNPEQTNRNLQIYYFSLLFSQNYTYINFDKITRQNYDYAYLENVFEFFNNSEAGNEFFPKMLYKALKIELDPEDEKVYFELKKSFKDNLEKLNSESGYSIATSLNSYCLYRRIKGDKNYAAEQFEIIKLMLENDLYHNDLFEYMEYIFFYNTVALSLELKEIKWCEQFIERYKDKLAPAKKNVYLNFSMAMLNEKTGKLEAALEYVSKIKPEDSIEKAAVKSMEINYYFKLGYFMEINSLIKNAIQFYKGDKSISSEFKSLYMNYFKAVKKIVDIRLDYGVKKYDEHFFKILYKEIENKKLAHKGTVLRMFEDVKNVFLSGRS